MCGREIWGKYNEIKTTKYYYSPTVKTIFSTDHLNNPLQAKGVGRKQI